MGEVAKIRFACEPFKQVFPEARPLMELHWQEIAMNKQLLTINPDVRCYEAIADKLLLITARDGERLIGYFLWILGNNLHYKHITVAEEDLHFLLSEYRRGMTGYNFVKAACRAAEERGAQLLVMREKIGHQHLALMQRLKFKQTDIVYTRICSGGP